MIKIWVFESFKISFLKEIATIQWFLGITKVQIQVFEPSKSSFWREIATIQRFLGIQNDARGRAAKRPRRETAVPRK